MATPAQPVVVIQYRSRGVSSWVFFPLILVIPLGAILIYHRLVVERYRVQAVESRRVLETLIDAPRSGRSLPGASRRRPWRRRARGRTCPCKARPGLRGSAESSDGGAANARSDSGRLGSATLTAAESSASVAARQSTGAAEGATNPSTSARRTDRAPSPADPAPADAKESPALVAATAQPHPPAENSPTGGSEKAGPRLRTILPNPSAPDGPPAAPSPKREGTGLAAPGGTISTPAGVPSNVPSRDSRPANRDAGGGSSSPATASLQGGIVAPNRGRGRQETG